MHTLTVDQQATLLEMINEEFGSDLVFDEFSDVLLGMFEDIAGFEEISHEATNHLVNLYWSKYHGQVHQEI